MKKILDQIPPIFKNFYFLTGTVFLIWILFIDRNDLITHFSLKAKVNKLEDQERFYQEKIIDVEKNRQELKSDDEKLEKFAREKYLMKKENEDLYIIEKTSKE